MEKTASYKVKNGKLIKIKLISEDYKIKAVQFYGDFFLHPEESLDDLEHILKDQTLEAARDKILSFFETVELVGALPEDFYNLLKKAFE